MMYSVINYCNFEHRVTMSIAVFLGISKLNDNSLRCSALLSTMYTKRFTDFIDFVNLLIDV